MGWNSRMAYQNVQLESKELDFSKIIFGKSFPIFGQTFELWQTWVCILGLVLPSCVILSKLPVFWVPYKWNIDNESTYLTGLLVYKMSGSSKSSINVQVLIIIARGVTLEVASSSMFCEWNCKFKRYKICTNWSFICVFNKYPAQCFQCLTHRGHLPKA